MTNPNSASPKGTDPNSAPSFLRIKLIWLLTMMCFWITLVGLSGSLANFLYKMPAQADLSSALLYLLTAMLFFYWSSSGLSKFVPDWTPLIAVSMAASVLLFKFNSHLYVVAIDAFWLNAFQGVVKGQVFPWSWPARMLFVPDHVIIERVLAEETPKPEEVPKSP